MSSSRVRTGPTTAACTRCTPSSVVRLRLRGPFPSHRSSSVCLPPTSNDSAWHRTVGYFGTGRGTHVDAAACGVTWARASECGLTRLERASGLAKRPYDLRHAGIFLLVVLRRRPGRVRPPGLPEHRGPLPLLRQVPGRGPGAGQSPRRAVDGGMGPHPPRRDSRRWTELGPGIDRNSWSGAGYGWDEPGVPAQVGCCDG